MLFWKELLVDAGVNLALWQPEVVYKTKTVIKDH